LQRGEEEYGLGEEWTKVEDALSKIIPVYDRTNRFISFGTDTRFRKMGLSLLLDQMSDEGKSSLSVLDLGSGPGKMTNFLVSLASQRALSIATSTMLDALPSMMKVAKRRNPDSEGLLAVYEGIPLRDCSADCAIAGFAIRDSQNLSHALTEVKRVLKVGGYFLIVDLSKPDSSIKRKIVSFYWHFFAPFVAFIAAGPAGLRFGALYTTFKKLPLQSQFVALAERVGYETIVVRKAMADGVCIVLFRRTTGSSEPIPDGD
jgi:demethylmenaquinone methyltransferase/2-methoxy-6-polyprenyl-1,4-benzoquinol methylase